MMTRVLLPEMFFIVDECEEIWTNSATFKTAWVRLGLGLFRLC